MSIDLLQEKIRTFKNPSVLSLEPTPDVIPPYLLEEAGSLVGACRIYCKEVLQTLKDLVPGVRVSLACFLSMGMEGMELMQELLVYAKGLGYYVILDNLPDSWGAVGETLAKSVLGDDCPWVCDSVVVNGYCGTDTIKPFLPPCKEGKKSLFILVKSPNRSSVEIQDMIFGGRLVHTAMADLVNRWGSDAKTSQGYSEVGAVVGATYPEVLKELRSKYQNMFLLLTGLEIQGASPKGCQYAFDRIGHGAAVCAGRYILGAWAKEETDGRDYATQALAAAQRLRKNLSKYVTVL